MQFTSPIELNFRPEKKNEIFGVPLDRANEMVDEFNAISKHVVFNKDEFMILGTDEFEGMHRIDEGKILERLLAVAKNFNEWAFTIYSANAIYENIELNWKRRSGRNALFEAIAEIIKDGKL